MYSRLQYISQGGTAAEQEINIRQALDAGCGWIQLRFKGACERELTFLAEKVKALCAHYQATFIVNDHPAIAAKVEADGTHLGLSDMKIAEARALLGGKIIGGTANTTEDALRRAAEGCDYIGLGPFRFTATKEKLSPVLGPEGYRRIMGELGRGNVTVPVYAIGGIRAADVKAIMETGVYGIAVSGAITGHANKKELIKELNKYLYEYA
ncbi:MAG: thiamine phosphate synthase [Bacteroidota bacterium]